MILPIFCSSTHAQNDGEREQIASPEAEDEAEHLARAEQEEVTEPVLDDDMCDDMLADDDLVDPALLSQPELLQKLVVRKVQLMVLPEEQRSAVPAVLPVEVGAVHHFGCSLATSPWRPAGRAS